MMNLYEKNLKFFEEQSKAIYDTLTSSDESKYDSKVTAISPLNLKVENAGKTCFIHSLYDKKRENKAMFPNISEDAERMVIFGMGTGNCINYICEKYKKIKNITIIEPDLNVFKEALNYLDIFDFVTKAENVTFIINLKKEETLDIIWKMFQKDVIAKFEWVYNISYRSLYADYYEYINLEIIKLISSHTVNLATNSKMLQNWIENAVKNSKKEAVMLSRFLGKLEGIPVIIVGAGPSLNYNMHYLKEVKDKAIIIAAGSAIKVLDSNGIVPHFRIAFDAGEGERNVFKNIDNKSCPLIFSDLLNYHIVEEYKGNKVRMTLDSDFFSRYIARKLYNDEFVYESGFSVTNVAMSVAIKLGLKKIIFMGQDLCYTEGSLYAKGSWMENDGNLNFLAKGFIKTTNVLGETVYSNKPFLAMRDLFERKIKLSPDVKFINATERGLNIAGASNKTFADVIAEDFEESRDIEGLISEIISQNHYDEVSRKEKIMELDLVAKIEELDEQNDNVFKRLKKLKKYKENGLGINKLQSELNYIKGLLAELDENELCREVVRPTLQSNFSAISAKHQYNGTDETVLMEREIKALLLITAGMKNYLKYLKSLYIEENL